MKVLLVNGSPNREGCTFTALSEVAASLNAAGIDTEIFWIGDKPIGGCVSCGAYGKLNRCAFNDKVNEFTALAKDFDGFLFGSPVYYAGMNGNLKCLMDRAFYSSGGQDPNPFRFKPVAAVASARRAGTTSTLDQIQKYFYLAQMPIVTSRYWPMVHGNTPDQVRQDLEGMQVMRMLGRNMAWLLKAISAGKDAGIGTPEAEGPVIFTNFVR